MHRLSSSVRVFAASLVLFAVACAEEEDPALEGDANYSTTPDGGYVYDGGSTGGQYDSGFQFPGVDAAGLPGGGDGGFADSSVGTDATVGDGGAAGGNTDGGTPGGGGGGPYVRGPAPTTASASAKGSYTVKSYTSGYADGADFGSATVWYPTDATAPFAIVAVCPGFVSGESDTAPWGGFLASHGIATITVGTNTGLEQPDVRARALLQALKSLSGENTRSGSPLVGKLDLSRQAIIGWSMGGGGSLLAAEQTPSLKAAISLAGWNPGYKYSKITVPSMLFAAEGDTLAGGADQSPGFYASIPAATPKWMWRAPGTGQLGGHYMFNDPAGTSGTVGRYGLSWMKVFLEGDDRYKQFLPVKPAGAIDFKTNVTP